MYIINGLLLYLSKQFYYIILLGDCQYLFTFFVKECKKASLVKVTSTLQWNLSLQILMWNLALQTLSQG